MIHTFVCYLLKLFNTLEEFKIVSAARPMLCSAEKSTSQSFFFIFHRRFTTDGSMVGKNKIHIHVRYAKTSRNMFFCQFWKTFIFAVIFIQP